MVVNDLQSLRQRPFFLYFFAMMGLLMVMGGGLTTTCYVLIALSFLACLWWRRTYSAPIGRWQRGAEIVLVVFAVAFTDSYLVTSTPNVGLNEVISMLFGILMFVGASRNLGETKHLMTFLKGIVIVALIASVYGFMLYIFSAYNRFGGPFTDLTSFAGFYPNAWFDFVLLTLPASLFLSFHDSFSSRAQLLGKLSFVLLSASLVLTYSRGGFISLVIAAGLGLIIFFWQRKALEKPFQKLISVGLLAVISILLALSVNFLRTSQGYENLSWLQKASFQANEQTTSISERSQFFSASYQLIGEKPRFGHGPYSFRYVFPAHQQELLALSDHPHNIILKIFVENGLSSLIFFLWFGVLTLIVFVRGLFQDDNQKAALTAIIGLSLLGIFSHQLIDYNLNFLSLTLLSWAFLGILFTLNPEQREHNVPGFGIIMTIIIVIGTMIGIHEAYYGYSLSKARSLDKLTTKEAIAERVSYYEKALPLFQTRNLIGSLSKDYLLQGDLVSAEKLLEKNAPRHPHYAELWYLWGETLRLKSELDTAKEKFQVAIEQDPLNELRYYLGMFQTVDALGDAQEREKWQQIIESILETYMLKLKSNEHFTVLTSNPLAAKELYLLLNQPEKAAEIQRIFDLEMGKLENPRYNT